MRVPSLSSFTMYVTHFHALLPKKHFPLTTSSVPHRNRWYRPKLGPNRRPRHPPQHSSLQTNLRQRRQNRAPNRPLRTPSILRLRRLLRLPRRRPRNRHSRLRDRARQHLPRLHRARLRALARGEERRGQGFAADCGDGGVGV